MPCSPRVSRGILSHFLLYDVTQRSFFEMKFPVLSNPTTVVLVNEIAYVKINLVEF